MERERRTIAVGADSAGRPVRGQLVGIWQANAGGRYVHKRDQHPAPLDPHFPRAVTSSSRPLISRRSGCTARFTTATACPCLMPRWRSARLMARVPSRPPRVPCAGTGRCSPGGAGPGGRYTFITLEAGPSRAGAAPFFAVAAFARGLLDRLFTQSYLPADPADPADPGALAADELLSGLDHARRNTLIAGRGPDGSLRFDVHLPGKNETVFLTFCPQQGVPAKEADQ